MANLSTIAGNIFADSGIDPINVVLNTGSYSNPSWITALSWTKISDRPTTLAGYGISDAVPSSRTLTINGTSYDLSANRSWTIAAGVSSIIAGTGISVSGSGDITITNTGVLSINGSTGAITGIITTSNYNSYSPTLTGGGASGTWGINITGTAGSISGFNNPTTAATANTIAYRDSLGDLSARYFMGAYINTVDDTTTTGMTYIMAKFGDNYHRSASAAKVQVFLGLGSMAYQAASSYALLNGNTGQNFSVNSVVYASTTFNPAAGPRNTEPMSIKMWNNYFNGTGLGSDYGTVLQYYSLSGHVDSQVYFDASGGSWFRTASYAASYGAWQRYVTENSGTWGISITGNSATATAAQNATFLTQPNATWGARMQLGGNGAGSGVANIAVLQATDGNIHMDNGVGKSTYINYYHNGIIYLSGSTYYISANGSQYNGNAATSTYSLNSTRLYASDAPYTYGGTNPYYMYMTYDGARWFLQVSPASPSAVRVSYADSSGNAATVSSITSNTGLMVNRLTPTVFVDGLTTSNFRSTLFGTSSNGAAIAAARWNSVPAALSGMTAYGTMIAWSGDSDTQGYMATNYDTATIQVGGGNANLINWRVTLLHSSNYNSYSPTLTGGGASGTWGINITGSSATPTQTTPNYAGGQQLNPQVYFNNGIGVKVAMTGAAGYWSDTLWINGYTGGDVLSMCALHTQRDGTPRMYISTQQSTASAYGTLYEFLTSYNASYALNMNQNVRSYDSPTFYDLYSNQWIRNNIANTGLYNTATTMHWSSQTNGYWDASSTTSVTGIRFYTGGHMSSIRGFIYADSSNNIGFLTNDGNWAARVDSSKNLNVSNGVYATAFYDSNDSNYYVDPAGGTSAYLAGEISLPSYIRFRNGGAPTFINESYGINLNGAAIQPVQVKSCSFTVGVTASGGNYGSGNIYATGDVTAYYSDGRLKHNLNRINNALSKVLSLNGYTYQHNILGQELLGENPNKIHSGLIAQEVQKVLSEVVTIAPFDLNGFDDNGNGISKSGENYLTIKYERLVPLLIEAIKEQQIQIEELKKSIN